MNYSAESNLLNYSSFNSKKGNTDNTSIETVLKIKVSVLKFLLKKDTDISKVEMVGVLGLHCQAFVAGGATGMASV